MHVESVLNALLLVLWTTSDDFAKKLVYAPSWSLRARISFIDASPWNAVLNRDIEDIVDLYVKICEGYSNEFDKNVSDMVFCYWISMKVDLCKLLLLVNYLNESNG